MKSHLSAAVHSCPACASHSINAARSWRARLLSSIAGLCAGLMVVSAQAAFQLVEDFDSLTLGDIDGQHGWVASLDSGAVVPDPAGDGKALKVLTQSGTLHKAAKVAQGTTRMLFLRFRFEEHGQFSFGLSHLLNPDEFSDFGPELGMGAATNNDPNNDFRVANGLLPTGIYDVLRTLTPTIWYNAWVLVDTSADTYQVWMNSDPGGDAQASDQLASSSGATKFGFRTATVKDLINFFIKTGGGSSPVDGRFYIDDIYLENTDNPNLNNPTGGGTDPGDTDPGDTDPGDTDPGDTDPGDTDPGDTDPGDTDPGDTDPGDTDPGDTDPGDTDPGDTDPGDTDPGDTDPVDSDPVDSDPGDTDPVDSDPVDSDPVIPVPIDTAFQLVEDFDSLALGDINGQNGWVVKLTRGEVVVDPAGDSSQALKVSTESGTLYKAASVAQGTTRMLFLRLRFEEHGVFSFGLSHLLNPDEFSDFGPELGMAAATANDPGNDFRVANGFLPAGIYDVLRTLEPTTWYNTWVLVHNTSDTVNNTLDTYEVWMNSDPGGDAQASDQLSNDAAETLFGFRTTTAVDLINFYIKTGGGDSPVDGRFYIDDIYLGGTDDVNLSNPLGDVDSNNDGISDADALALGLDPNDPDGDTDGDGATDVIETGGDPSDPQPVDTDVDGVIDALEPGTSATDASVASSLRLSSGDTVTITAAGEMLSQVSVAAASGEPPAGAINFPFGSISYTTSSPVGGSVTTRLAFSADLPILLALYKENNGVFTVLPTSAWTLVDARTVDITLTDGDPVTDLDGVANGFIEDPVAPAAVEPVSTSSSSGGGGGCALNTAAQGDPDPVFLLLMLAVLGYQFRRRRL